MPRRAPPGGTHDALRLLRDDAPAGDRVELLLARAGALATCGHFTESHAALLESYRLAPADAVALRIRLTTACAKIEHLLGLHEAAHQRLTDELADLDDPASPEAVALMLELAVDGVYTMRFPQIAQLAEQALETARPLGDPLLIATTAAALAWGTALCGLVPEAEKYRAEAAALVDDLSDRDLARRLDSAVHLAGAELHLDRFAAAGDHAVRVIAVARATGQPAFIPLAFMVLAWVRLLRGELADGAAALDAAIEESRLLRNDQSLAGLNLMRSLTALAAGDLELAVSTARESVDLTRNVDAGLPRAAAPVALCAALLESGDPGLGDAVDLMVQGCGGPGLPFDAGRQLPRQVARTAHPMLDRARTSEQTPNEPPPPLRTLWGRWADSGWPRPWPSGRRPRSPSRRETPSSPREERSRRQPPRTTSGSPSRPPSHAPSPGVPWREPVNPNAPSPSSRRPPPRCTPAVP